MLTWKCASRHNCVGFSHISSAKSGPTLVCFVHFDLDMCFAPRRCALCWRLNFQTRFETVSFLHFWLGNALRATTACFFSTSQLPKVAGEWCWTCASRHDSVQFVISHLARWLRTCRFGEPTFRPPAATNNCKNTVLRHFPIFSCTWIFFLWSFFFFSLLWLFRFSSVYIVGSLSSKLLSIKNV